MKKNQTLKIQITQKDIDRELFVGQQLGETEMESVVEILNTALRRELLEEFPTSIEITCPDGEKIKMPVKKPKLRPPSKAGHRTEGGEHTKVLIVRKRRTE